MAVLRVVYDDRHRLHRDEWGIHVEKPERLDQALSAIRSSSIHEYIEWKSAIPGDESVVGKVHSERFVEFIREESRKGYHYLDPDTYITSHTYDVALSFATTAYHAALDSLDSRNPWLLLARPPGHHSGREGWAMGAPTLGFCVFNHSAVAARAFLDRGLRVFMLDFDAHHGNGTQDIYWFEPRVLHVDIHQHGIYPGTGWVNETGGGDAEGTKVNVPLAAGSGDSEIAWVAENILLPLADEFKPDAVVVSAGFDGFAGDPLTGLEITSNGYSILGHAVRKIWLSSRRQALVVVLEGGYGAGLREGLRSFLESLLGARPAPQVSGSLEPGLASLLSRVIGRYWRIAKSS